MTTATTRHNTNTINIETLAQNGHTLGPTIVPNTTAVIM